jgi:hypothetical protein
MITFRQFFSAEFYKYNKSRFVYLLIAIPVLVFCYVFYQSNRGIVDIVSSGYNPWLRICALAFPFYSFVYPCLAIVVTYLVLNIDYKNNGFRMLFSYPIKRNNILYVKFLVIFFWYMISLLLGYLLVFLTGYLLSSIYGISEFYEYEVFDIITPFFGELVLNGVMLILLHFILNLMVDDLILTTLIPVFLVFIGFFLTNSSLYIYLPYAYGPKAMNSINSGDPVLWRSYNVVSYFLIVVFWMINLFLLNNQGRRRFNRQQRAD